MIAKDFFLIFLLSICGVSCTKSDEPSYSLDIYFKFDENQERLDSNGNQQPISTLLGSQNIKIKRFGIESIEFNLGEDTNRANKTKFFNSIDTVINKVQMIQFNKMVWCTIDKPVLNVPLNNIPPGDYKYIKIVIGAIEYDVDAQLNFGPGQFSKIKMPVITILSHALFIDQLVIGDSIDKINNVRPQGFCEGLVHNTNVISTHFLHRMNSKKITSPNALYQTAPSPKFSGEIVAKFENKNLVISDIASQNMVIELSFSTNHAFEFQDGNKNNILDIMPFVEGIENMGLRGLKATVK